MPDRTYVFLDLETTGLDQERDEIIEIGAVKVVRGEVIDTFHAMVKPRQGISYKIKKLTGITEELLENAEPVNKVLPGLLEFIGHLPVAGHNILFDLGFINRHPGFTVNNEFIDTMDLARLVLPSAASYRLSSLTEKLGCGREMRHRALEDAGSAADIFFKMLDILRNIDISVLRDINRLFASSDWPGKNILLELEQHKAAFFPAGKIEATYKFLKKDPSAKDILFMPSGKKTEQANEQVAINPVELNRLLETDGPFAKNYPEYKYRPQQADIVNLAAEALNNDKHLLIEAGTGTGKSLAYLLPAIFWAVLNNSRVVIATHTINLQEQLWLSDLPVIKRIAGLDFKEALVKGRNNYLCLRKWEQKKKHPENLNSVEKLFYARLQLWLTETIEGDRGEINLNAQENALWLEVCADSETCLGPKCSWFGSHCFYMNSRRQAEEAQILITNHSVLLSDLRMDNRVLPAHDYLVIDEAHNLEDQAGEQLGVTVSSGYVNKVLSNIKQHLESRPTAGEIIVNTEMAQKARDMLKEARTGFREFIECLISYCQSNTVNGEGYSWQTVRIHREQPGRLWDAVGTSLENLLGRLKAVAVSLEQISRQYSGVNDIEEDVRDSGFQREMEYYIKNIRQISDDLKNILLTAETDTVAWVEFDQAGRQFTLKAVPVSVGEILAERLFQVKKSVILSSATLSVDGNFDHFKERTGLKLIPDEDIMEIRIASPFNYEEQSFLGVIRDLPDPGSVPDELYASEITPVITGIIKIFEGRTLILFTSHRLLKYVYKELCPDLEKEDITVLGHNIDGSRTRLIEEFRANSRSVLLGANSFWEGVDLPGDILKCVVIVKLPFAPPNQPLTEARIEKLAELKKNGFTNLLLPQAVIRMKQGFGRLIRSERDEGVVIVLDRRITDKRYGRKFLNSLPLRCHIKGDRNMLLQKLTEWLDGKRTVKPRLKLVNSAECVAKQLKDKT